MTKAKAVIIPVTPFQQNCTLLWCDATKRAFCRPAAARRRERVCPSWSFTNEDSERSALLHHDALAVDDLKPVDETTAAYVAHVDRHA